MLETAADPVLVQKVREQSHILTSLQSTVQSLNEKIVSMESANVQMMNYVKQTYKILEKVESASFSVVPQQPGDSPRTYLPTNSSVASQNKISPGDSLSPVPGQSDLPTPRQLVLPEPSTAKKHMSAPLTGQLTLNRFLSRADGEVSSAPRVTQDVDGNSTIKQILEAEYQNHTFSGALLSILDNESIGKNNGAGNEASKYRAALHVAFLLLTKAERVALLSQEQWDLKERSNVFARVEQRYLYLHAFLSQKTTVNPRIRPNWKGVGNFTKKHLPQLQKYNIFQAVHLDKDFPHDFQPSLSEEVEKYSSTHKLQKKHVVGEKKSLIVAVNQSIRKYIFLSTGCVGLF